MQSEIEDKYSMYMVKKFYENCFTLIRYIGGTLVVLNGTGIVALLSLDIDKYKDALYWFSCGLVSLATIFIFVSIFMNPFLHKRSLKNDYKVMFIYKLLFIVFNIGNIFSSIFFMVGVGVSYDIIWKILS